MLPTEPLGRVRRMLNLGVRGPGTISPTAHYTGSVWARHGLGPAGLATPEGAIAYRTLRPAMAALERLGRPSLEQALVARHQALDALLTREIAAGASQIVEVAAGLSPRGHRFVAEYGDRLSYLEADLPPMAAVKRERLERWGPLGSHHRVVEVDALARGGPMSLAALLGDLDPARGTVVITEGLIPYLSPESVMSLWRQIATEAPGFARFGYLSDLYLQCDSAGSLEELSAAALSVFVRGRVRRAFADAGAAAVALRAAGFGEVRIDRPAEVVAQSAAAASPGGRTIRVLSARP